MKILHVAHIRNNPFNGVCVAVSAHIIHQSKLVKVALLNIIDCKIEGVDKQFIYTGGNWVNDVSEEFKEPDLVVFHEVYHLQFAKIAKSLRNMGIPYIIVPHGSLVKASQQIKRVKKIIANTFFFRRFIHCTGAVQCLSESEFTNTMFRVKKFIGTNGVVLPPLFKKEFHTDKIVISYIGRLQWKVKGVDLLIKATKQLHQLLLDNHVEFHIYGPDKFGWLSQIEKMIKENSVEDLFVFHDAVRGDDKLSVLLDSDLFIQTSRHEGMPMGILEALSFGLPCLVTVGTALGNIIKKYNAGWVADNNVDSICNMISTAINDKGKWMIKSKKAREMIENEYSWDVISKSTINNYKQIVNK